MVNRHVCAHKHECACQNNFRPKSSHLSWPSSHTCRVCNRGLDRKYDGTRVRVWTQRTADSTYTRGHVSSGSRTGVAAHRGGWDPPHPPCPAAPRFRSRFNELTFLLFNNYAPLPSVKVAAVTSQGRGVLTVITSLETAHRRHRRRHHHHHHQVSTVS